MAVGLTAEAQGLPELQEFLRWAAREIPGVAAAGLERGAAYLEGKLRENLSGPILHRKTSTLVRSVGHNASRGGMEQRVGATTFYLATHEGEAKGAANGFVTIKPVRAKALAFDLHTATNLTKSGKPGKKVYTKVFAKQVRIPIRRPVGVTYDEHREAAFVEVEARIRKELESYR